MGVAYYIVSGPSAKPLYIEQNGKAVADVPLGRLDRLCREAGVRPVSEFFSQDPDEAAAFCAEEGFPLPPGGFPPRKWFDAADGLRTVRALLAREGELGVDRGSTAAEVTEDLRGFEESLEVLDKAGVQWHLAVAC